MSEDYIIPSRSRDLGGFEVHRSLPSSQKRQLGPFVFLDHMGPLKVDRTHAMDVRPHPHIGLATVTYLFDGRGMHRDSLGYVQEIKPGDLNWMTAGRGIVHSERTPEEDRYGNKNVTLHGVQIWVGLPKEYEECEPSFKHWPQAQLPLIKISENLDGRVMLGRFQHAVSPVQVLSPTLFMDVKTVNAAKEVISFDEKELGIFLITGSARINKLDMEPDDLIVIADPKYVEIEAPSGTRFVVIGGDPFPEQRYMWWNFVSTRKERIREAAEAWKNQTFAKVPGETDFTPLPTTPPLP